MGRTEHQLPQDQQQLFRNPQSPISNPQSPIPNPQPPIPNPQSPISNPQSVPSLSPPRLLDTPWVPTFHNARRAELILEQAARADLLVVLALPDVYTPEPWVEQLLKKQPRAAKRLLLVLNQVDTVDRTTLFGRGGFSQAFEENLSRLRRMGVPEENVLIGCARLPFLESGPADAEVQSRAEKLRHVLGQLRRQVEPRPESAFKRAMLRACTPEDAGLGALRERLMALRLGLVRREREKAVLDALMEIAPLALPVERRDEWMRLRRQVASGKW